MEEQQFTVWKSSFLHQEGALYIIIAGGFYQRNIYAEGHVLIVRPTHEPVLFHLEPTHFPKDVGFELASLLKAQFEFGRDKLTKWFFAEIGYQGYADIRQLQWEPFDDVWRLASLLRSDRKVFEKFEEIVQSSNSVELERFVHKARDMARIEPAVRWDVT